MGSNPPRESCSPIEATFSGFLFDMDGTIIDSTPAIIKHWQTIGKEIGVSAEKILATSHGRRSIDVFKILDPGRANWHDVRKVEGEIPLRYGSDAREIPGARSLLAGLDARSSPRAIVTSATEPLVDRWLRILSMPRPAHLITAESVEHGKPSPICYRQGLERLGLGHAPQDVLVLEDSPAGIEAGKAAGCRVLALVTSHTLEQVVAAGVDWVVKDLDSVRVAAGEQGRVTVQFRNALYR